MSFPHNRFWLDSNNTDVRKSVHHHTIQIIQPTRCNNFTSLLLDAYVWHNMFRASPRPSSGAYTCTRSLWFYRWRATAGALLVVVWQVCSTCFGRLPAHHREHTATYHNQQRSGRCFQTVKPDSPSAIVCSWWWAGDTPNMLSHTKTSSNKLVKLLHLVGWIIWMVTTPCKEIFSSYFGTMLILD
jgi:hypothetical protein